MPEAHRERQERGSPVAAAVDLPPAGVRHTEPAIFRTDPARTEPVRGEAVRPRQVLTEPARRELAHEQPISGPSFLGLNAQPEGEGEYLLEDEPSRGGLRKVLLLVIILAILGLIFVQWRSSFKASPKALPSKAEPANTPAGENRTPAPADTGLAAKDPAIAANANDGPSGVKDPASNDPASNDPKTVAENPIASMVPSAESVPSSTPVETEDAGITAANTSPLASKAPSETHLSDSKPSPALQRAQQFLQGRGVPQNCEQGMLYLKAATDKGDPRAAVQMGALYSSGHCVQQDRVQAYKWFSSAHDLEPQNAWIEKNLNQLWAQMTPLERRLAGY